MKGRWKTGITWVVLDESGKVFRPNERTTGKSSVEMQGFMNMTLNRDNYLSVSETRRAIATEREDERLEFGKGRRAIKQSKESPAIRVLNRAPVKTIGLIADGISDMFESLLPPAMSPEKKLDAEIARVEREEQTRRKREIERDR